MAPPVKKKRDELAEMVQPTGIPHHARCKLKTVLDTRREAARVYRGMRGGVIPTQEGTRLVSVLGEIAKMIEASAGEREIETLRSEVGRLQSVLQTRASAK